MASPHHSRRRPYALLIATVVLASCAGQPPVRDVDDSVRDLRAEYLNNNPRGEFNWNIERGEVALGMRFEDVLASWGIPDERERESDGIHERWTYTITDAFSLDWARYDFIFEKRALASWETMRNVASSHPLGGLAPGVAGVPAPPANSTGLVTGGAPRR